MDFHSTSTINHKPCSKYGRLRKTIHLSANELVRLNEC